MGGSLLTEGLSLADRLTIRPQAGPSAGSAPLGRAIGMKRSTFDAFADFEQRLSDVLKDVQRARLDFAARLATTVAAEKRERDEEHADKLDGGAEIARWPPLRGPLPSNAPRSWWPFRRAG